MRSSLLVVLALCAGPVACGPSVEPQVPTRAPLATQWLERARTSYHAGDFDDARDAGKHALAVAPNDVEIRELAARVALTRLDFDEALRLTEGLESTDAHGIRGRAYWYTGDVEHAADELETMLTDPRVKDAWARDVAALARRGVGRHPYELDGGIVGEIDMPRSIDRVPLGAAHVVPCELDGQRVLALVATGSSEVLLDANERHEPAWVSLRFDRLEVKDVPALVQDLSPISRQVGVPVKALLGAQLLRHAHVTFDRRGDQFVVRRSEPTSPPDASRVPLFYARGGGMLLRASLSAATEDPIPMLVDSARPYPLVLQDATWKRAGIDVKSLTDVPGAPNLKGGMVPTFRMGGFDLAKLPAISGVDMTELTTTAEVDLAGIVGADLLAFFRVTFADEGRFMWIEPDPTLVGPPSAGASPRPPSAPPASSSGASAPPAPSAAPSASAAPAPAPPRPASSAR